jgi:hypothetical protein
MAVQIEYEFADAQTVVGDNTTTIGSTVSLMNLANNHRSGWHTITHNNYISAEIGGMTFVAEVVSSNVAGGNLTVSLKTAATNNLNATGTVIGSVAINNGAAIGNRYALVVPYGTKRLNCLGAIITRAGNVTAGNINIRLTTGGGAESPSS